MRKHSNKKTTKKAAEPQWSVGLDLGDRSSHYAIVDRDGELIQEGECRNTPTGLAKAFAQMPASRIALETGSQSGWIARELTQLGHKALVANARELRGIWGSVRKNDRRDAEKLAKTVGVEEVEDAWRFWFGPLPLAWLDARQISDPKAKRDKRGKGRWKATFLDSSRRPRTGNGKTRSSLHQYP